MNLASLKNSRAAGRLFLAVAIISALGLVAGPMIRGRMRANVARASVAQQDQQRAQLEQEAAGLRERLGALQQKALAKNPALSERQHALITLIESKLKAGGTDPAQIEKSIREQQAKAQDPKLPEAQRQSAMTNALGLMQRFEQARNKVVKDPAVAGQLRAFKGDLLAAMKKEDPSVPSVIKKLEETELQLQLHQRPS